MPFEVVKEVHPVSAQVLPRAAHSVEQEFQAVCGGPTCIHAAPPVPAEEDLDEDDLELLFDEEEEAAAAMVK